MLIVLGLSHCDELPSSIEVESSINRTIDEVERLIHSNSSLPHLSRREIVDILFNITSKDFEVYKNKETIEEARKIYQRALMVVLPFKAEDAKENLTDLYTRPPIIRVIADPSLVSKNLQEWNNEQLSTSTTQETRRDEESLENLVVTHASEKATSKEIPSAKTRYKNHRETYSEVSTKTPLKFDSAPIKFSFNLENLQKQQTIERSTTTRRPVFRGTSSTKDENVFIVYSTSATVRTTETSPKDILKISTSRPFKQETVLSANQWRYNAPTSSTTTKIPDLKKIHNKQSFSPISKNVTMPTMISKTKDVTEISKITSGKIKDDAEQLSTSIYVTPTTTPSSSSFSSEKPKYNFTYNFNSGGFRRITTTPLPTTTTMRPELMDLLASIGLRPENANNVEEVFEKSKESFENSQIANNFGFVYPTSGLTSVMPDLPSITSQNTFENPIVSEIGKGINNLTPDVQLLFQRFGLQTSNPTTTTTSTTLKPTEKTNSYTNFKALPTLGKVRDPNMKDFLAQFGLGVSDNRQKKAMPLSTERPSLIEAVPGNMRQILENVGLISRRKVPKTTHTPKLEDTEPTESTRFHVFKPHEVEVKDEKQKMKINELLDMIRLVQEGKANATDVRKAASDLLETAKILKDGPDPLKLEEIVKMYNEDTLKNEVKRQNQDEAVETTTNNDQDVANITPTTATFISTGIRRFMISVLGTSEYWVRRIIQGLTMIRSMLTNMGTRTRSPD